MTGCLGGQWGVPQSGQKNIKITAKYVKDALGDIVVDQDLSRYIL